MTDAETPFPELPRAARILEERFGEIFEDYERRLNESGSLLVVGGGLSRKQIEANAWSVVSRAASVLRGEERSLFAVEEEIHQHIEASEEPLNPHPDESFRSGVALCKAAVKMVVGNLPEGAGRDEVAEIALAVQEIVMDRVSRMVMASYIDYLLTKVKETQFEERRRFSRELHDRLAHSMTVVTQSLDLYEAQRESNPQRATERLALARQTADDALELMRQFSSELRGMETSEGLRIALENLMRISVPIGVDYEVSFTGEEDHLPDFVRDQLYLVLREGVRNAVAHSGSDRIEIEVSITPKEVLAVIRDAGLGFDAADPATEGIGLDSMKERTDLLGGAFELVSEPDGGTRAEVRMPLLRKERLPPNPE
ncbi:MAG: sensor histidine kinase [Rubrobacter sp.]|nr:sensor histidine kinase [Rubrobacter sp.]